MPPKIPLEFDQTYHIFNRGNNRQLIFREDMNYRHFLRLLKKYIFPIADIFAYVLLPNHFHFLLRIKSEEELNELGINTPRDLSQKFSNLFNAYAKAYNKKYNQVSSLFEDRFERIVVKSEADLIRLVWYLHWNPQKHGYIRNYKKWKYSSYQSLTKSVKTSLSKAEIIELLGGLESFKTIHDTFVEDQE